MIVYKRERDVLRFLRRKDDVEGARFLADWWCCYVDLPRYQDGTEFGP